MSFVNFHHLINKQFNFNRIKLYEIIIHYKSIRKYYEDYVKFLKYFQHYYPIIFSLNTKKLPIFIINNNDLNFNNNILKYNLSENTFIIFENDYYKYVAIKLIIKRIIEYESIIKRYIINMQYLISDIIQGLTNFKILYKYLISNIILDTNETNEHLYINDITSDNYIINFEKSIKDNIIQQTWNDKIII